MFQKILKHTNSLEFTNALKITIAAIIPVFIFSYLNYFDIGLTLALGAFYAYPTDIPSTINHKIKGIIVASLLFAILNLIINLVYPSPFLFYPLLGILVFLSSMLTVYGQRATMISFSALLAITLSFAHIREGLEIFEFSGYIFAGGIFYLLISLTFHYIQPYRYLEIEIAEGIKLTAKYLKLRGDLWSPDSNRKEIIEKQLNLQIELNLIHENLRQVLFSNKNNTGTSGQSRKMIIVFITLVEIQELALSTSFDYEKLHKKFKDHPRVLEIYQNLAYKLASVLKNLANSVHKTSKLSKKNDFIKELKALEKGILDYQQSLKEEDSEGVLMLTNMLKYGKQQSEKIKIVKYAFALAVKTFDFKERNKDLEKFLTPQYYPIRTLIENFSFSSTLFRHSLRLTITLLTGFLVGKILPFQNVYWIILTIVVIMRPGYGLTKERSYHRIFGTLLGAGISFGIVSIISNHNVIGFLAIICMLVGISFSQKNYKIGATFITMYVVFVYGILTPNVIEVIQFRILDSLVGAILAFLGNYFLWPSWEFLNITSFVTKSIEANRNYLRETADFYNSKGIISTSYRLSRKNAFIEIGNLMTSFRRMTQEPKSKQILLPQVNKLTVLNHSLLSSTASLGTYIQSHRTTKASNAFNFVVDTVIKKLDVSIALLNSEILDFDIAKDQEALMVRFQELKKVREKIFNTAEAKSDKKNQAEKQEIQLVIEQLIWLNNLSDTILKTTKEFIEKNKQ